MMAAAKPSGTAEALARFSSSSSPYPSRLELVIENVVRRVLFIVREETRSRLLEQEQQEEKHLLQKKDLDKFKLKRIPRSARLALLCSYWFPPGSASAVFQNINQPGTFRMLEDSSFVGAEDVAEVDEVLPPFLLYSYRL